MSDQGQASTQALRPEAVSARDFVVGQNRLGQWLAVEIHGFGGGIFVTKGAALRYAVAECDRRTNAVRISAEPIDLRI